MLKSIVAWPVVLLFYGLGHLASKWVERTESERSFCLYTTLMLTSWRADKWGGCGWWVPVEEGDL
jgi:hypothetical protein